MRMRSADRFQNISAESRLTKRGCCRNSYAHVESIYIYIKTEYPIRTVLQNLSKLFFLHYYLQKKKKKMLPDGEICLSKVAHLGQWSIYSWPPVPWWSSHVTLWFSVCLSVITHIQQVLSKSLITVKQLLTRLCRQIKWSRSQCVLDRLNAGSQRTQNHFTALEHTSAVIWKPPDFTCVYMCTVIDMNDRCSQEIVHMDIMSHFSSSSFVVGLYIHLVLMFWVCACAFVCSYSPPVCNCLAGKPLTFWHLSPQASASGPWTEDKDSSKKRKKLGNMKMKEWRTGTESRTKCSLCFLLGILETVPILPVAGVDHDWNWAINADFNSVWFEEVKQPRYSKTPFYIW